MYDRLFTEGKIGCVTLKNRLVMSPMGIGLANLDGTPSEDMIAYYEARAIGGAGLIIPEITRVNDVHGPGLMRYTDTAARSLSSSIIRAGKRLPLFLEAHRLSLLRISRVNTYSSPQERSPQTKSGN